MLTFTIKKYKLFYKLFIFITFNYHICVFIF